MSPRDIKRVLNEDWMRFFKTRLAEIDHSEVEHNNAKIISFSWPQEVLALIDDTRDSF